jgi:hypothetical protein
VDAYVSGNKNDFGVALVGSKVVFGVARSTGAIKNLTSSSLTANTWYHVAVTRNTSTGSMELYVNGTRVTSGSGPAGTCTDPPAIRIGGNQTGDAGKYFNGRLDEVRIYERVLSSAEITDLWAVGNMVMHLALDDASGTTADDNVGAYDGTLVMNGPTWTTGTWSGALSFDGDNDYVRGTRPVQDDFTLAAWVNTTSLAICPFGNANQWWDGEGVIDADLNGNHEDFGCSDNRGKFCFGTGDKHGGTDKSILSSTKINDGTWHHVSATRDGKSGEMKVYVDGIEEKSGTGYTGKLDASGSDAYSLRIGGLLDKGGTPNPDPARLFKGQIDDVRIYGRILTADQISLLLQ